MAPATPAGPTGPTAPVAPVNPIGPCGPCGPIGPDRQVHIELHEDVSILGLELQAIEGGSVESGREVGNDLSRGDRTRSRMPPNVTWVVEPKPVSVTVMTPDCRSTATVVICCAYATVDRPEKATIPTHPKSLRSLVFMGASMENELLSWRSRARALTGVNVEPVRCAALIDNRGSTCPRRLPPVSPI